MSNYKLYQFFRGSIVLIMSNVVLKSISFFLLPLYTAYLSPNQLGTADSITSVTTLLFTLAVMGMDSAFGAFFYSKPDGEHQNRVFNTALFHMFIIIICLLPLFVLTDKLSMLMFHEASYGNAIKVSLLAVLLNLWYLPFSLMLRLQNKMTKYSIINLIASLTIIFLNVYFVTIRQLGFMSLLLSILIVNFLQICLYYFCTPHVINIRYIDFSLYRVMLKYALPMLPMIMAAWILNLSDRYILLYYCGEYEVGIYGIAARFLSVLSVITSGIYTAYTSFAFSSVHDKNAKEQYVKVLDAVFCVLFTICVTVSLFGKEVITVMANERYLSSYMLLLPLLFGQLCYAVNTIIGYGIAHAKRSLFFLAPTGIGTVINLILNLIFIPHYGAKAAAVTTFLGYFVMMVITYFIAGHYYKCPYHFKKIIGTIVVAYIVVSTTAQANIAIKFIIWCLIAGFSAVLYRDILIDISKIISSLLNCSKIPKE